MEAIEAILTRRSIRKYLEKYGAVHKYHIQPHKQDNDIFLVLGSLNYNKWKKASMSQKKKLQDNLCDLRAEVRNNLMKCDCIFELELDHIWIIEYLTTTLEKVGFRKKIKDVTIDEMTN